MLTSLTRLSWPPAARAAPLESGSSAVACGLQVPWSPLLFRERRRWAAPCRTEATQGHHASPGIPGIALQKREGLEDGEDEECRRSAWGTLAVLMPRA